MFKYESVLERIQKETAESFRPAVFTQKQFNTIIYRAIEAVTLLKKLSGSKSNGATLTEIREYLKNVEYTNVNGEIKSVFELNILLVTYTLEILFNAKKIVVISFIGGKHYVTKSAFMSMVNSQAAKNKR